MMVNERNQEGEGLSSLPPLPENIQIFHPAQNIEK
jgi:hypothetical protein